MTTFRVLCDWSTCRKHKQKIVRVECPLLEALLSEEGISVDIREKHEDLERYVSKLEKIEKQKHKAFIWLKNGFALSKLQYILRASPAHSYMADVERFDDSLVAALAVVTNMKFGQNSLNQVALSIRLGGLGNRLSKGIAPPVRELVDCILNNVLLPERNDLCAAEREWNSGGLILAEGKICR